MAHDTSKKPLICLAAAGGGHFRQLFDIQSLWASYPRFIVTEDTALTRALSNREDIENVPHFALGQARIGKGLAMVRAAAANCAASLRIILRRRPDIVITTGSGSQFFIVLWARLLGSKVVLIDSFARFHAPSKFARLAGPLAHLRIAQSAVSARKWRGSKAFDPLEVEPLPEPASKEPLVFATVGATLPFERLERCVTELKRAGRIPERVLLQVGRTAAVPEPVEGLDRVGEIPYGELQSVLDRANLVVCHAGTGSIITALSKGCAVVAVPRTLAHGDHYDDHQAEIASVFASRGLVETGGDAQSIAAALDRARTMPRHRVRMNHRRLIGFLDQAIETWFPPPAVTGATRALASFSPPRGGSR